MFKNQIFILLAFTVVLLSTGCQKAQEPPVGAIFAAFHFCPTDECDKIEIGSTTKQIAYTDQEIYDRWCVEVRFTRNGKAQTAAVIVDQVDLDASVGMGDWTAFEPVFNADCSTYK